MGSSRMRPSACSRIGSRLGASVVFAEMKVPPSRGGRAWAAARREVVETAVAAAAVSERNRRREIGG